MRKFCFAAIALMITAGCGDAGSSNPDPEPVEPPNSTVESTEVSDKSSEKVAASEDTAKPGDETKPVADKPESEVAKTEDTTDKPAEPEASPVAAKLEEINKEYSEKMKAFQKWYSSASDEEKKEKFEEYYPEGEAFAKRIMDLAIESPDDPATVKALAQAATMSRGDIAAEASGILFEKYPNDDAVAEVVPMLGYNTGAETEKAIRSLLSTTTNDRIKGFATLTLAQYLSRAEQTKQLIADNPDAAKFYADKAEYLEGFKLDKTEVESLYTTVIEKYASVSSRRGTLGESAEAALFELKNLQIGMPVPDIEGADLDGVEFKLSDYKGKVVLLDFWGNW